MKIGQPHSISMLIFFLAGTILGLLLGVALFYTPRLPGALSRGWQRYVLKEGKLVEAGALIIATAAALFAGLAAYYGQQQFALSERTSKSQLRAYVLFDDSKRPGKIGFTNFGETVALQLQTMCTREKIPLRDLSERRKSYGGTIAGHTNFSDLGKQQTIYVTGCDEKRGIEGEEFTWAAVTYYDIFWRCQHSWVLLADGSEGYVVNFVQTTDPEQGCVSSKGLQRSNSFPWPVER
jgi:hypothetical protein